MASGSCSYISSIYFSRFTSDIRLDTIINVHPTYCCSKTKWRSLFFAPASEICNAVFLLAARTLGFPDVVAVDRSDMGSSFSGLYTILRPSPVRVETPETARTYRKLMYDRAK